MVNCAPQLLLFLVCMNVSRSQVGKPSFLLCFCPVNAPIANFCCLVSVDLSLEARGCPHYMYGFQTFGNLCSG